MSRTLQEAVMWHGNNNKNGELQGPFYCGMSTVMPIPEFSIALFSPTSTSCHIEVAMKFSGSQGVIMEFNNVTTAAKLVKGLDVSWISRYREEDERYEN